MSYKEWFELKELMAISWADFVVAVDIDAIETCLGVILEVRDRQGLVNIIYIVSKKRGGGGEFGEEFLKTQTDL